MPTLSKTLSATGVGNAASPNEFSSAPNNALELISSADDTDFAADTSNNSGTTTVTQGYLLDDMPTGANNLFVSMNSVSIRIRYGWASTFSNRTWTSLQARIVNGVTILAASNSGGDFQTVATSITTTTPTNSNVTSFSYVNTTASKSTWDGATVEIRIISVRSGGGSSVGRRVYALEITGNYEALRDVTTIKAWNGTVWQAGLLKRYNGSTWEDELVKRWNGSEWVNEYGKA